MLPRIQRCRLRIAFACLMGILSCHVTMAYAEDGPKFESEIRPIFREYCFDCHGAGQKREGGLDLRLVRFLRKGGESGPAINADKPMESRLLEMVRSGEMPPGEARVPPEKIAILERWISEGAKTLRPEPETIGPGVPISVEDRNYWAYLPIQKGLPNGGPLLGTESTSSRIKSPIDRWIESKMPKGLSFSPEADRNTLIRRAYFTLIGLPPSREELEAWLADPEDSWFDKLIDTLLESPHYGERWARHWLDVAGYADSDGYTVADADRPWAWKYRDYVIRALNADKPLDRFIHEQLAGDELAGPKQGEWTAEQIELLTATGFMRTAADGTGSGDDSPEARNKVIADSLKIVGSALLGSSLHCAQCHDHRYDPISQLDYFAIRSVFEPSLDWQKWQGPPARLVSLSTEQDRAKAKEIEEEANQIAEEKKKKQQESMALALEKELEKYDVSLRDALRGAYQTPEQERTEEQKGLLKKHPSVNITPGVLYQYLPKAAEELKKFDERIAEVRKKKPAEEFVRVLTEPENHAPIAKLFHRGEFQQPLQEVLPAGLTVASKEGERVEFPTDNPSLPTTGRRLAFAQWLTSPSNPLLARVLVNRIWMHHFGQGIVATPGEFGKLGSAPTHPELLDWLAAELIEQGWSMKQLHRIIMKSTVWQQRSTRTFEKNGIDPENRYLWRRPLLRLDAEIIRDRMLAAVDRIDRKPYGPPVAIKEDETGQVIVDGSQTRRSIYIRSRRTQPVAMLQAFDAPVMEVNCEYRPVSTVATQSLILLNGEFTLEQARHLADRTIQRAPEIPNEWIDRYDLVPTSSSVGSEEAEQVETDKARSGQVIDSIVSARRILYAWQATLCRRPSRSEMATALEFLIDQTTALRSESRGVPKESSPERQALVNLCQMLFNSNEFLYID